MIDNTIRPSNTENGHFQQHQVDGFRIKDLSEFRLLFQNLLSIAASHEGTPREVYRVVSRKQAHGIKSEILPAQIRHLSKVADLAFIQRKRYLNWLKDANTAICELSQLLDKREFAGNLEESVWSVYSQAAPPIEDDQ